MAMPIVSAEERLREKRTIKLGVVGVPGIGKTTLLTTLPEDKTLHLDFEGGDLAVASWHGDAIRPRTWQEFRDLVVFLTGPVPWAATGQAYSQEHYAGVCSQYGDPAQLAKYDYYFIDSLSALSRLCFNWAKAHPRATTDKGQPDTRAAYGLLASEMVNAISVLQHVRDKHLVFVAILNERVDDRNQKLYDLQLEGGKTAAEFPGVIDVLVTLTTQPSPSGPKRVLITKQDNPLGVPAKDRSGRLSPIEDPHLGRLIAKCLAQPNA
jgi:hypothetical protein